MPTLAAPLDLAKLEARNFRAHILGAAPSSPVTGQLYYNSGDNTLYWWNGTAWISASGGGGGAPSGPAGGDLTGTYPNPGIAAGVIIDADVSGSAAIAESKLSLASDAVAGTASRRTLGAGAQQAAAGNHALTSHPAPSAALDLNSQKITTLGTPTNATDAATMGYVDSVAQGLDAKQSVRLATTGDITTLAGGAPSLVDGTTVAVGDRILVKSQSVTNQNGIYTVTTVGTGSNGTWARAADMDSWLEVPNAYVWVETGTVNGDTGWVSTAQQGGTLGSTSMPWVQFASAGAQSAGAGLTKTGNTFDVGQGTGLTVNADDVQIATGGVTNAMLAGAIDVTTKITGAVPVANGGTGQTAAKAARETGLSAPGYYSSATHGAGTTISITAATHGLRATRGLIVQVQEEATGNVVLPDISVAATGDVTVTFGASVAANAYRVTVLG